MEVRKANQISSLVNTTKPPSRSQKGGFVVSGYLTALVSSGAVLTDDVGRDTATGRQLDLVGGGPLTHGGAVYLAERL
jgi:hypothetical protein